MGNVGSRPDEGAPVYLKDQNRFSLANLTVTNSRGRILINATPNSFPATRYAAKRDLGDYNPIDYIQDPNSPPTAPPSFLLRLSNDDELTFNFTCVLRQLQTAPSATIGDSLVTPTGMPALDTQLTGLTFVFASNDREVDQLVTREFHADPNLHKNPNVALVGNLDTAGVPSVQLQWSWKWRPPKLSEDLGGGWRNTCSFVEYNQRAHRLETLASFSFWMHNSQRWLSTAGSPTLSPPRLRVPSAQSIESRVSAVSDSDGGEPRDYREPSSPMIEAIPEYGLGLLPTVTNGTVAPKVDINCVGRPGGDVSTSEDGPLFRATMRQLEQKTGTMRSRMKRVLRAAEAAQAAQTACNDAHRAFMDALREASTSNANAVRPALDHYFDSIASEILLYERQNNANLQRLIIDPITKLYSFDIKQAESKKRDFDEESKDYYAYVSKYLGQRSESLKEKKRVESDAKYQAKRRTFELKRFDYSSFMHDLNGGRKEQEVLSQLTRFADAQAKGYLSTAKKVEEMLPQLEALIREVTLADKEYQLQRTEREEKRRALETNSKSSESDPLAQQATSNGTQPASIDRSISIISAPKNSTLSTSPSAPNGFPSNSVTSPTTSISGTVLPARSSSSKFKGIRDLEEKDPIAMAAAGSAQHRKEGLLWSLSRPGSHVDPIMNKAGWHKFWIVLDQGKLSEYVNWKDKLDLHMEPIDLRVASVREARNAERRFCFEVITPQYTRVYQAPSEEDMKSWIASINNALQSAFEAKPAANAPAAEKVGSSRNTIAAVLTGKASAFSSQRASTNSSSYSSSTSSAKAVSRHATTGDKPTYMKPEPTETPSALLNQIREADAGNKYCADCNSDSKVEWVSINLGIILCIECSGIHRSLGTHISKVRSLTLDTSAFTPDIVETLILIGNRVSNMVWEAKLDNFLKPGPNATREQRLHFISGKYSDRLYVQGLSDALSHFKSPDDTLLASIKQNNIQQVLYALALRANPNAADRSRGTHAVYLALAAADPASPSSSFVHSRSASSTVSPPSLSPALPSNSSRPTTPIPIRKPFPVAEMLLQNGADIPAQPAPIPLSRAAQQYLEFKIDQKTGRHLGVGVKDAAGDGLSALPSEKNSPKDRDSRLLKRQSTGSKSSVPNRDGSVGKR